MLVAAGIVPSLSVALASRAVRAPEGGRMVMQMRDPKFYQSQNDKMPNFNFLYVI